MRSSPLLALDTDGGSASCPTEPSPVTPPPFRWSTRVFVPVGLIGGMLLALLVSAWSSLAPALAAETELAVLKTVATRAAGTVVVQAAGWIESDPYLFRVTSLASGVVEELLVLEGDRVEAGQVLARLDPDDARLARDRALADLRLRRAAEAEARVRLLAARTTWENPVERERRVAAADANLAETRARKARIRAERQRQEVILEQAGRTYRRLRGLGDAEVAPVAEVEEAETALRSGEVRLDELSHALAEAVAAEARHQAELDAAQRLLELRIEERRELDEAEAALQRIQAAIAVAEVVAAEAELRANRMEVRAPRDGVVVSRYKSPGDRVMVGGDGERAATLFSLYDPRSLQVRVDVPLVDAAKIAVGQPCEVVSDVLSERRFPGRVTRILHQADIQKNTLEIKVSLDEPAPELRPEMLARVRFLTIDEPTADTADAVFVPADSVREDRVWVVAGFDGTRGVASARPVRRGREEGGWLEVEGVQPGDLVVRVPPATLRPGQRLRPIN